MFLTVQSTCSAVAGRNLSLLGQETKQLLGEMTDTFQDVWVTCDILTQI
jgi:hypothetical protein